MVLFFNQKNAPSRDLFKSSMAEGSSCSLDRVSEYYIYKAEQLQAIIQVDAEEIVDVIFSEGTDFGGNIVKQAIAKTRDGARVAAANQVTSEQFNWSEINNAMQSSKD